MVGSKDIPKTWRFGLVKKHFVGEMSDGNASIIIYKVWSKNKNHWIYRAENKSIVIYELELCSRAT